MDKMLRSGVKGVREGADVVSHTIGDVLDDVRARVDDLVEVAHPKQSHKARNGGGLLAIVVLAVVGYFVIRAMRSKNSTSSNGVGAPSEDSRADSPAVSANHQHDAAVKGNGESEPAKSSKSGKSTD